MANAKRGEVTVEICGEEYNLVYNNEACCGIEATFGDRALGELFAPGVTVPRRVIIEALRFGMLRRHRHITSKKLMRLLDDDPNCFDHVYLEVMCGVYGFLGATDAQLNELRRVANDDDSLPESPKKDNPGDEADDPRPTCLAAAPGES